MKRHVVFTALPLLASLVLLPAGANASALESGSGSFTGTGDIISVKEASRKNPHIEGAWQTAGGRGRPSWIAPADGADMSVRIETLPTRADIDRSINEQLIVELYSK